MNQQDTLSRADGWLTAWVDNDLVMMNAASNFYLGLSGSGGRIWELLETPQTFDSLCEKLIAEYDAEPAAIAAEVSAFLAQLEEHHAIEVHRNAVA
jgi:hypothetical protein